MEVIQPISAAEQGPFCVELMKRLNIQRKQDYLCDITLVSKDNIKFKAHRNVLSAASPYFDKLLQSNMKENREGIVRFEEISGSVLEDVLEFIYIGTVEVTQVRSNASSWGWRALKISRCHQRCSLDRDKPRFFHSKCFRSSSKNPLILLSKLCFCYKLSVNFCECLHSLAKIQSKSKFLLYSFFEAVFALRSIRTFYSKIF